VVAMAPEASADLFPDLTPLHIVRPRLQLPNVGRMIDRVLEFVSDHWGVWFDESRTPLLVPLVLTHASKINRRAAVFVFESGQPEPRMLVKVSLTDEDAASSEAEYRALASLHGLVPGDMSRTMPRPLGFERVDREVSLFAETAISGSLPVLPTNTSSTSLLGAALIRRYTHLILNWSRRLADSTTRDDMVVPTHDLIDVADRFSEAFPVTQATCHALDVFRDRISSADLQEKACWQHGDISPGNVLIHKGQARLTDWEHANSRSEPWRDAAQIPSTLYVRAFAEEPGADATRLAVRSLGSSSRTGRAVKSSLEAHWDYSIPLSWAVLISTMRQALQTRRLSSASGNPEATLAHLLLSPGAAGQELDWLTRSDDLRS
jgi:hypothetical protein